MESKKINQLATELTPALSDLTIIGDPTTGISKKITLSQMASLFTGTVEEYANLAAFPLVGVADTIYIALDTNVLYRWDTGLTSYVELSPNIINSLVFSDANGFDGTISLVGSVATLTITTALTTGSVPFIGASGALSQDNANYFWDNTNKRLGINTNAPTTALDVFGSGIIGRLNGTSTNNAFLGFASAGTNKWSIGNVQSDHRFRIYNEATTSELVSVLQTGEFGIGIANPTTKLHIDGGATALIANLDANVSVAKSISFRSDNSNRINLEVSGTESGSNAGANFFIRRYSDVGALIDTPLTITRSTGDITFGTGFQYDNANKRLGINQLTPLSQLHIVGVAGDIFTDGIRIARNGTPSQYGILNYAGGTYNYLAVNTTSGEPGYNWLTSVNGTSTTSRMTLNTGTYMLDVTGSGRFTGIVQMATGSQIMGNGILKLGIASGNAGSGLQLLGWSTGTNWQIDTAFIGNGFNITPSTTSGGSTFTTPAFTILPSGNTGIGTISPSYKFEVSNSGTGVTVGDFYVDTANNSVYVGRQSSTSGDNSKFYVRNRVNTLTALSVDPGGNGAVDVVGTFSTTRGTNLATATGSVGIGTSTPGQALEVNGNIIASITGKIGFRYSSSDATQFSYLRSGTNSSIGPIILAGGFESNGSGNEAIRLCSNNNGSERTALSINNGGTVTIAGALSKGSGSFRIDHPLESMTETHQLVHSFVEAPQADLYYRGKLILVNGKAQANIDEVATMTEGTFEALCREVQCFTTNESGWDLIKGKVIGNIIYIESQNAKSTDEISWLVIGERKDKHIMDTDWTDENGKVIVEPLKPIIEEETILPIES